MTTGTRIRLTKTTSLRSDLSTTQQWVRDHPELAFYSRGILQAEFGIGRAFVGLLSGDVTVGSAARLSLNPDTNDGLEWFHTSAVQEIVELPDGSRGLVTRNSVYRLDVIAAVKPDVIVLPFIPLVPPSQ